jgi:hypothetical protein
MSDQEETDAMDVLTRRDVMSGGSLALLGALGLSGVGSQSVAAQTGTEPRIQLGSDAEIDDYDPGDGNQNVRIRHQPSGTALDMDGQAGTLAWLGKEVPAVPATSSNPNLGFGTWREVSSTRPAIIQLRSATETDGTTQGAIRIAVDESGGTSTDYQLQACWTPAALGSGSQMRQQIAWLLPPGAKYKIENPSDPANENVLYDHMEFTL